MKYKLEESLKVFLVTPGLDWMRETSQKCWAYKLVFHTTRQTVKRGSHKGLISNKIIGRILGRLRMSRNNFLWSKVFKNGVNLENKITTTTFVLPHHCAHHWRTQQHHVTHFARHHYRTRPLATVTPTNCLERPSRTRMTSHGWQQIGHKYM